MPTSKILENIGWLDTTSKRFSSRLLPDFCYQKLRCFWARMARTPPTLPRWPTRSRTLIILTSNVLKCFPYAGSFFNYYILRFRGAFKAHVDVHSFMFFFLIVPAYHIHATSRLWGWLTPAFPEKHSHFVLFLVIRLARCDGVVLRSCPKIFSEGI